MGLGLSGLGSGLVDQIIFAIYTTLCYITSISYCDYHAILCYVIVIAYYRHNILYAMGFLAGFACRSLQGAAPLAVGAFTGSREGFQFGVSQGFGLRIQGSRCRVQG